MISIEIFHRWCKDLYAKWLSARISGYIVRKLQIKQRTLLIQKPDIFRKVKKIKHLSGGVVLYAAQTDVPIDVEIAENGGFWTETS
ncbi:MAG: hypothetical protein DRH07_10215 [Deltaproteobacteria bacterium]|nr:MAG: hypothetical protein DRH07_10215 [Deltaproteobacteria bacterium]